MDTYEKIGYSTLGVLAYGTAVKIKRRDIVL
jgi:hypothetical protein